MPFTAPLHRPLTGSITRPLTQAGAGGGPSAFSAAKFAIEEDAGDVNILVVGDSTGDATNEWPYLFADWLANQYPTHSVNYKVWVDGSNDYGAPVVLSTGSGANTVTLFNGSVSGSKPSFLMGSKFANAITAAAPDLVIWNHGHNLTGLLTSVLRGEFVGPMEQVRLAFPSVPHAMIAQNPRRDDNLMAPVYAETVRICNDREDTPYVDVYAAFIAAGKPAGWYTDSVHPNATGQAVILGLVQGAWNRATSVAYAADAPWLATNGTPLNLNSTFAAFAGATPDSWPKSGTGTLTKETVIVAPGSAHSVKLVMTGTQTATFISQTVSAVAQRGQEVTLAVLMRIEAGGNVNTGFTRQFSNGTGAVLTGLAPGNSGLGGFRWVIVSGYVVEADATLIGPFLYANNAANQVGTVYIDRAILVAGRIPRNAA